MATRRPRCWLPLLLIVASVAASAAAPQRAVPPDGLYRLDTTGSTTIPGGLSTTQATDGRTGDVTVTQTGQPPRRFPGTGPVTRCVRGGVVPSLPRGTCVSTGKDGHVPIECPGISGALDWRAVDAQTWEARLEIEQDAAATAQASPAGTIDVMLPHLSAADRQKALALKTQLPAMQQQQQQAMAQVRARMESELKTASPEEAAMIRQALAAMQGKSAAARVQHVAVQRLTRIADRCPAP